MYFFLDKLRLVNFKGIRSAEIDFGHVTELIGQNATGKTTVLDGFLWLLFGKDSTGRKDFEIKTLNPDNSVIERVDHEVEGFFHVDGHAVKLRRVYAEKWQKIKGAPRAEFTGHTTEYFWNDVPLKEKEYAAKIANIIPEDVFRLLTNTAYFNALPWQEQRAELVPLIAPIDDEEIFTLAMSISSAYLAPLRAAFVSGKTLEELKKEVAAKRTGLEKEIAGLPGRIDEARRSLPEPEEYAVLEAQRLNLENELANIDRELQDELVKEENHNTLALAKQKERFELQNEKAGIEFTYRTKVAEDNRVHRALLAEKKSALRFKMETVRSLAVEREKIDVRRVAKVEEQNSLRAKYIAKNKETLPEDALMCPSCHRPYESDDRDGIENHFNAGKAKQLQEIDIAGRTLAGDIRELDARIAELGATLNTEKKEAEALGSLILSLERESANLPTDEVRLATVLAADTEYQGLIEMIRLRTEEIDALSTLGIKADRVDKLNRSDQIRVEIRKLTERIAKKEQRDRITKRIDELVAQEDTLADELAKLDGVDYAIGEYSRAKMQLVEDKLNGMFTSVKFKLFDRKINGAVDETCVCLINGVPYPSANTAGKVQAGLDIINVFSKYYKINAPIWIDNRESVISLPATESQVICLRVVEGVNKLTAKIGSLQLS